MNKEPNFEHDGWKWYEEKILTRHANKTHEGKRGKPLNAKCFRVEKEGEQGSFVLIGTGQKILAEDTNYEQMAVKIDMLKLTKEQSE